MMKAIAITILLLAATTAKADHTFWVKADWNQALEEPPLDGLPANGNVTIAAVVKSYTSPPLVLLKQDTLTLEQGQVYFPFVVSDNLQTVSVMVVATSENFAVARHGPVHMHDQLPYGTIAVYMDNWQSAFGALYERVKAWEMELRRLFE